MKHSGILLTAALFLFSGIALSGNTADNSLPTVVVVTTGGTIAEKYDPSTGGVVPAVSGNDLLAAVPGLNGIASIEVVEAGVLLAGDLSPYKARLLLMLALAQPVMTDEMLRDLFQVH